MNVALEYEPADVVVAVPILGRPHLVAPLVASIRETAPLARIMFGASPGDTGVLREIAAVQCERVVVPRNPVGDYARKINAIYRTTTEPLIFVGAVDLVFHPGWFEAARAALRPGIGVVGTNDLGSPRVLAGEHATHFLVTRDYADQFGTLDGPGAILFEGYPHEYVDDELIGTARMRDAWAMALDCHVEHMHPDWGKAPSDALYREQHRRMRAGAALYRQRRRRWM